MGSNELLRRLNAGSDDDGDSEGDGEDDIEGESEDHESRTCRVLTIGSGFCKSEGISKLEKGLKYAKQGWVEVGFLSEAR